MANVAGTTVTVTDHSGARKEELDAAILRALERCGSQCEGYAVDLAPYDTGRLRGSITHQVDEANKSVMIGTNVDYAPYVELGTGIHATNGGGRNTAWSWQDDAGNWHRTRGQEPQPFLKPAVTGHEGTIKAIFEDEIKMLGNGNNT